MFQLFSFFSFLWFVLFRARYPDLKVKWLPFPLSLSPSLSPSFHSYCNLAIALHLLYTKEVAQSDDKVTLPHKYRSLFNMKGGTPRLHQNLYSYTSAHEHEGGAFSCNYCNAGGRAHASTHTHTPEVPTPLADKTYNFQNLTGRFWSWQEDS